LYKVIVKKLLNIFLILYKVFVFGGYGYF